MKLKYKRLKSELWINPKNGTTLVEPTYLESEDGSVSELVSYHLFWPIKLIEIEIFISLVKNLWKNS